MILGLIAALCFSGEVVLVKQLTLYKVDGDLAGLFYTFFVGIIGMVCLSVYGISGGLAQDLYTMFDYLLILFGSIMESLGMICQIYAASIGVGGIAFALANTCCIYVTLFNYLAMS